MNRSDVLNLDNDLAEEKRLNFARKMRDRRNYKINIEKEKSKTTVNITPYLIDIILSCPETRRECTCCKESVVNIADFQMYRCGHFFHESCIARWRKKDVCPTCNVIPK